MGSKIKLTDTSGRRFPKKPRITDSDLTSDGTSLTVNSSTGTSPVSESGSEFASGLLISDILITNTNIIIDSNVTELYAINLIDEKF